MTKAFSEELTLFEGKLAFFLSLHCLTVLILSLQKYAYPRYRMVLAEADFHEDFW